MRKLATYMLGVGLGVVMVYFFFGDRDRQCNYFPNDRVLYDLRKKAIAYSPAVSDQIQNGERIDSALVWALERGQVDFEKSNSRQEPCGTYLINLKEPAYQFLIENCDSKATLLKAKRIH